MLTLDLCSSCERFWFVCFFFSGELGRNTLGLLCRLQCETRVNPSLQGSWPDNLHQISWAGCCAMSATAKLVRIYLLVLSDIVLEGIWVHCGAAQPKQSERHRFFPEQPDLSEWQPCASRRVETKQFLESLSKWLSKMSISFHSFLAWKW